MTGTVEGMVTQVAVLLQENSRLPEKDRYWQITYVLFYSDNHSGLFDENVDERACCPRRAGMSRV